VSAPNRAYVCAPVSVYLPRPTTVPAPGYMRVRDQEAGQLVPATTMELPDGRLEVTWLVRDLPQGSSRQYRLAADTRAPSDVGVSVGQPANGAVEVRVGGDLFTRYVFEGAPKPYCYPVVGPTGVPVTRAYPMEQVADEAQDHPHQRSFWFTHGELNGVDFWAEGAKTGREAHKRFGALVSGGACGIIRAGNDWVTADGAKVCEDERELRVYNVPDVRLLDFTVTVKATEGPVEFGDTKEGTLGFRVAEPMKVDGHAEARITNSEGQTNAEAWGKAAAWCDYSAPLDGKWVGISILDHPSSFRHPTYWHVRTYGLFAANPFGLRHFVGDETGKGRLTLQPGQEVTFRYRVLIHPGNVEGARVADWYGEYADPPVVEVRGAE